MDFPAMRLFLLALLPVLWLAAPLHAQDPLIAKAVTRIASVEKTEATLQPGDATRVKKLLSDLKWAEKRLHAVGKNKGTPEWNDAMKRLKAVRAKVEAKGNQPKPQPAPQPQPGSGPKPKPTPQPGPGSGPKPSPGAQPAYDHAKVVQLNKEVGNAWNNLKMVPLRLMNDASRVKSVQKEIAGFRKRLEAMPAGHENVKIVKANLDDFEGLLNGGLAKLEEYRKAAPRDRKAHGADFLPL